MERNNVTYVKIDDEFGTGAVIMRNSERQEEFRFFEGEAFAKWPIGVIENFSLWKKGKEIKTHFVQVTKQPDGEYIIIVFKGEIPGANEPYITGRLEKIENGGECADLWPQYWRKMYNCRIWRNDSEEKFTLYMTSKGLLTLLAQRGKYWNGGTDCNGGIDPKGRINWDGTIRKN